MKIPIRMIARERAKFLDLLAKNSDSEIEVINRKGKLLFTIKSSNSGINGVVPPVTDGVDLHYKPLEY
jgi:hypothetical protein|tara:strand:- start:326 stop:529 length:204 start_codon:yes stop_codon:yes gene_type:complete